MKDYYPYLLVAMVMLRMTASAKATNETSIEANAGSLIVQAQDTVQIFSDVTVSGSLTLGNSTMDLQAEIQSLKEVVAQLQQNCSCDLQNEQVPDIQQIIKFLGACYGVTCLNGGTCQLNPKNGSLPVCICSGGFTGAHCESDYTSFRQGLLLDLGVSITLPSNTWNEITGWSTTSGLNTMFNNFNSSFGVMDYASGRFTVGPAGAGIYMITVQLQFNGLSTGANTLYLYVGVNGDTSLTNGLVGNIQNSNAIYFSLHTTGSINLRAGDYISVLVNSQGGPSSYVVDTASGFSVVYIGPLSSTFGVSDSTAPAASFTVPANNFQPLGNYTENSTAGAWLSVTGGKWDARSGVFTVPASGIYYISSNVRILNAAISQNIRTAFFAELASFNYANAVLSAGGFASQTFNNGAWQYYIAGTRIFQLARSDSGAVTVAGPAAFSVVFARHLATAIGFTAVVLNAQTPAIGSQGYAIASWYTTYSSSTWSSGDFDPSAGIFLAPKSGVYWTHANIRVDNAGSAPFYRLIVIRNGVTSGASDNGLHTIYGSPVSTYMTMVVGGAMYLSAGDTAQLAIYQSGNPSPFTVQGGESEWSLLYLNG